SALGALIYGMLIESTDDEVIEGWRETTRSSNCHARVFLQYLQEIAADPPSNLFEKLSEAEIQFGSSFDSSSPQNHELVARSWISKLAVKLTEIEDEERNSPEGVLREFLLRFWKGDGIGAAIERWREYAQKNQDEAVAVCEKLNELLERAPMNLSEILFDFGNISLYIQSEDTARPYNETETLEWLRNFVNQLKTES
ncbi:MAG: hypothetical protein AAF585_23215, partial [Verrucomicrobiota bacterium]